MEGERGGSGTSPGAGVCGARSVTVSLNIGGRAFAGTTLGAAVRDWVVSVRVNATLVSGSAPMALLMMTINRTTLKLTPNANAKVARGGELADTRLCAAANTRARPRARFGTGTLCKMASRVRHSVSSFSGRS
jgi:hypothetical protein